MLNNHATSARRLATLGLGLCLAVGHTPLWAAKDEAAKRMARVQQQMARLQQAQQVLEAEKGQITAEKAQLEEQVRSMRSDLDRGRSQQRREAERLRAEAAALEARLSQAQADHDRQQSEWRAQLKSAQDENALLRRQLAGTEQTLDQRVKALAVCESHNQGLYKLNTSLLAQYEQRSCGAEWSRGGPLTQLGRVKIENDRESYQDQFDSLRVSPTATP